MLNIYMSLYCIDFALQIWHLGVQHSYTSYNDLTELNGNDDIPFANKD